MLRDIRPSRRAQHRAPSASFRPETRASRRFRGRRRRCAARKFRTRRPARPACRNAACCVTASIRYFEGADARLRQRAENGFADAAFGPVVLDGDEASAGRRDLLRPAPCRRSASRSRDRSRESAMPCDFSSSAAFSASCTVMPAPITVTRSCALCRGTLNPGTGNFSSFE